MRSVTYKSVIDRIAGYMGEADGLSVEDAAIANAKINFFVRLAWQHYWWPDSMTVEQRTFRAPYSSVTAYVATTEVFNPPDGQYYQALQASTNQAPALLVGNGYVANAPYWAASLGSYSGPDWATGLVCVSTGAPTIVRNPADNLFYQCIVDHTAGGVFDPTKFGVLTPFIRSLDYEQAGQTKLGLVRFVWDRNPETNRHACPQKFTLRKDFIQVYGCANVVYPEFQLRVPEFSGATRDDDTSYGEGVTLYDTATGDYWTTTEAVSPGESPTSAPSSWDKVEFPYVLAEYAAQSAYAMMTDREQETPENFSIQNAAGYPLLLVEMDNLERKQGQTRQLNVQPGRSGVGMTPFY